MPTIGELRARRDAARVEATNAEERYNDAVRLAEVTGKIDAIDVEPPPSYRLLTDERAIAAARGEADGALAAEIEQEMYEGLAVIDRGYAENRRQEEAHG